MLRDDLKRSQEKLGKIWEEYRSFRDGLGDDPGKWTEEQREKFDKFDTDIDAQELEISKIEQDIKDEEREDRYQQSSGENYGPFTENSWVNSARSSRGNGDDFDFRSNPTGSSRRHSFNRFLEHGEKAISPEEFRSLVAGSDVEGGFLTAPPQFVSTLIKDLNNEVFFRALGTNFKLKRSQSMGAPVLDQDFSDADWTTELQTGQEDDLRFSSRELKPHPVAKRVKVSNTLLRVASLSPETVVKEQLVAKFAVTEEKAFMFGDGHSKPLGVFVPDSDGITEARDVVGDNTATEIKADTLIDAAYALKGQYLKNSTWIFHREAIRRIRKLKDQNGDYIWQRGLAGAPNTILERPYVISELAPSTFTTGQYVGIIGDFSKYWIATGLDMYIQRLVELYAENNQTGFIGRIEVDGAPVVENAFTRIKLG